MLLEMIIFFHFEFYLYQSTFLTFDTSHVMRSRHALVLYVWVAIGIYELNKMTTPIVERTIFPREKATFEISFVDIKI